MRSVPWVGDQPAIALAGPELRQLRWHGDLSFLRRCWHAARDNRCGQQKFQNGLGRRMDAVPFDEPPLWGRCDPGIGRDGGLGGVANGCTVVQAQG